MDGQAIGTRIGQLRTAKGWTIRELARRSGVSVTNLSDIERGKVAKPQYRTLVAITTALGWSRPSYMLESTSLEPTPDPEVDQEIASELAAVRDQIQELSEQWKLLQRRVDQIGPFAASEASAAGRDVRLPSLPPEVLVSRTLPIYGYPGAAQKLANVRTSPHELKREVPDPKFAPEIGVNGYGVIVEGDSLEALDIHDGDLAWTNPESPLRPQPGDVVLALIRRPDVDEPKMVIKQLVEDHRGARLSSAPEEAGESFRLAEVEKMMVVVCVEPQRPQAFRPGRAR